MFLQQAPINVVWKLAGSNEDGARTVDCRRPAVEPPEHPETTAKDIGDAH